MTGRKLGHFKFLNESMKKPMIERRRAGMFKKAKELSVLCDVEIGIIIFNQNERYPIVWPSLELVSQRFVRFLSLPEAEKLKKMVMHESYLRERINFEMERIRKKEKENERKEMNLLMNQIIEGRSLKELDARQLRGLYMLAGEKMQELEKRKQDLQLKNGDAHHDHQRYHRASDGTGAGGGPFYVPEPPAPLFADDYNKIRLQTSDGWKVGAGWKTDNIIVPPPATTEELILKDSAWFIPITAGRSGDEGCCQMIYSAGSSSINNGGGKEDRNMEPNSSTCAVASPSNSGHQLPSFNQVWPYNFFSSS